MGSPGVNFRKSKILTWISNVFRHSLVGQFKGENYFSTSNRSNGVTWGQIGKFKNFDLNIQLFQTFVSRSNFEVIFFFFFFYIEQTELGHGSCLEIKKKKKKKKTPRPKLFKPLLMRFNSKIKIYFSTSNIPNGVIWGQF